MVQVHVPARVWGFESLLRHQQCGLWFLRRLFAMRTAILLATVLSILMDTQSLRSQEPVQQSMLDCFVDYIFTNYIVGPDFTVTVESKLKPVSQLKVVLENGVGEAVPESKVVKIVRRTGPNGVARFAGLKAGKYSLRLDELVGPGFGEVTVVSQPQHADHIVLNWPDIDYSLLNVSGRMISFQDRMPLKGVQVLLLDLPAGREIAQAITDADGHYSLALPKDGVYALRFKPSATSDHHQDFGVEVNSVTGKGEMPLMVMDDNKSCGLNVTKAD